MPEIRENSDVVTQITWPRFGELVKEAEPCLYEVAHVEAA